MPIQLIYRSTMLENTRILERHIAIEVIPAVIRAGAEVAAEKSRRIVPIDTGALLESIRVVSIPGTIQTAQGPRRLGNGRAAVRAGNARVNYAAFIEYGTVFMRARPFLRLGAISSRTGQRRAMRRVYGERIREVQGRLRRLR